ncbi:MAG: nucleoside deaminase [Acholeplasmataceae bacterium]
MNLAFLEAQKAYQKGEVPVGAIIVFNNEVIGLGHNLKELNQDVTSHAEINAIKVASKKLGTWRLEDCDMYVTLEPCVMCAGAIIQSRIKNLYIATNDPKSGACGSVINVFENPWNHQVNVEFGIMKEESSKLLKDFFQKLR